MSRIDRNNFDPYVIIRNLGNNCDYSKDELARLLEEACRVIVAKQEYIARVDKWISSFPVQAREVVKENRYAE